MTHEQLSLDECLKIAEMSEPDSIRDDHFSLCMPSNPIHTIMRTSNHYSSEVNEDGHFYSICCYTNSESNSQQLGDYKEKYYTKQIGFFKRKIVLELAEGDGRIKKYYERLRPIAVAWWDKKVLEERIRKETAEKQRRESAVAYARDILKGG